MATILSRLQTLQIIYDARAHTYDKDLGFHPKQHSDFLKWMSLNLGDSVLDLACGTGGIALLAKKAVGLSGMVIGIDISPASLDVARSKAKKECLDINFLQHDVGNLQGLETEGIREGTFDVITCASAIVLLENPASAVKSWAKLLKKNGRVIFDIPTPDSMVRGLILEKAAQELGIPTVYSRTQLNSDEKITKLLTDAGLDGMNSFDSENYDGPDYLNSSKSNELFQEMVNEGKWFIGWYSKLNEPGMRDATKKCFARELAELADEDGSVVSYLRFRIVVGQKL